MAVRFSIQSLLCMILMFCLGKEAAAQISTKTVLASFPPSREVVYKKAGNAELRLHVFEPAKNTAKGRKPAIVFFHGGYWSVGTPIQFYPQCSFFAERGFLACSAEYRLVKKNGVTPFECVTDGKSAVRWLRQHAKELGIDPNRIVASGGEAGAQIAACTALIGALDDPGEDKKISSVPNALVLFGPMVDTTEKGFGRRLLGERGQEISPAHHVAKGAPPTILFHGTADRILPLATVERFAGLMREAGNVCELVPAEGRKHGYFNHSSFAVAVDRKCFDEVIQRAYRFLQDQGIVKELPAGKKAMPPSPSPPVKSK